MKNYAEGHEDASETVCPTCGTELEDLDDLLPGYYHLFNFTYHLNHKCHSYHYRSVHPIRGRWYSTVHRGRHVHGHGVRRRRRRSETREVQTSQTIKVYLSYNSTKSYFRSKFSTIKVSRFFCHSVF